MIDIEEKEIVAGEDLQAIDCKITYKGVDISHRVTRFTVNRFGDEEWLI